MPAAILKALKLFLSVSGIVPFKAILKAIRGLTKKVSAVDVKDLVTETKALAEQVKVSHADGKLSPEEAIALADASLRLAAHIADVAE